MYYILKAEAGIGLEINSDDPAENKRTFDALFARRQELEAAYGSRLVWDRLDNKKVSTIYGIVDDRGLKADEAEWPELQRKMIVLMERFSKAFKPAIQDSRNA